MNSTVYYHVTGRPPTARTVATDRNMIFYLEHQLHWDRERIQAFFQTLPANTNEPNQPWGRQFMNLQQGHIPPPPSPPFEGGGDDDFAGDDDHNNAEAEAEAEAEEEEEDEEEEDEEEEEKNDEPVVHSRRPVRRRNEVEYIRRSQRLNPRKAKMAAIQKLRTKRSRLLYKLWFGR
jgi:hypothetical protein